MTEFNVLTMNARAFPGTDPLVVRTGQRVRIRLGNLSAMDHHPIHLHGYQFKVTETDGGHDPGGGAVAGDDGAGAGRQHADDRIHRRTRRATGPCTAT